MSQTDHAAHIKTIFCDIDGCLFKHHGSIVGILTNECELLPGVQEKFKDWCVKGYTVILTTGRPESLRELTIRQINNAGLYYKELIMDLPRGTRIVVNDFKADRKEMAARGVNINRNEGLENVDI